jgi:hypothetical protein
MWTRLGRVGSERRRLRDADGTDTHSRRSVSVGMPEEPEHIAAHGGGGHPPVSRSAAGVSSIRALSPERVQRPPDARHLPRPTSSGCSRDAETWRGAFATTRWTTVNAVPAGPSESQAAQLSPSSAKRYWPPLYAYLRRTGLPPEEAQDLTQGFFARLLEDRLRSGRLIPRAAGSGRFCSRR